MNNSYPETNLAPIKPYEETFGNFLPKLAPFYADPDAFTIAPFQIFGNLYYVGDKKVCMHLVDTGDGLILFDSGYSHSYHNLIASIKALGFDPHKIRYVITSHGHFDHFGGGDRLRETYGAKILMSRVDTELLREMPERALCHLSAIPGDTVCWPDKTLEDGEILTLGNTSIRCVLAPGHTMGTMAFFFDVTDGEKILRCGYWGGVGFLTTYKAYNREYGLPENKCALMAESIEKLQKEAVDITIGNHPYHNCTVEKREYMLSHPDENPFVNENTWKIFLSELAKRTEEFHRLGY